MVEYGSTHFLGTQEQNTNYSSTSKGVMEEQSFHGEEQLDVAYEVQLSGKTTQGTEKNSTGIYQVVPNGKIGEGAVDMQTASAREIAKLSVEDQQKVKLIQEHVGTMLGEDAKVVLPPVESGNFHPSITVKIDSQVVNETIEGTISGNGQEVSGAIHGKKTTDINHTEVAVDETKKLMQTGWATIGTISQKSEHTAVGENEVVLGQTEKEMAESALGVSKGGKEPGVTTFVGDEAVFIPTKDENGNFSQTRIGDQQTVTKKVTEEEYTAWSAKGTVQTADGRTIAVDKTSFMLRTAEQEEIQATANIDDPLVIQYGEGNVGLTNQKYSFDLNSDGKQDGISFVKPGAGFLALDKNNDGKINDGNELFGTKSGNGFKDLANYDKDGNGWIDENDEVYSKLRIWSKNDQGEDHLMTLKDAGVGAIYLGSVSTEFALKDKNNELQGQVRQSGFFLRENGTSGTAQQIDLVRGAAPEAKAASSGNVIPSEGIDAWQHVTSSKETKILFNSAKINVQEVGGGIAIHHKSQPLTGINLTLIRDNQYAERGNIHFAQGASLSYSQSLAEHREIQIGLMERTTDYTKPSKTKGTFSLSAEFIQSLQSNATLTFMKNMLGVTSEKKVSISKDDNTAGENSPVKKTNRVVDLRL